MEHIFLIWLGLTAGRIALREAKESKWRGALDFSCHPLLVAVSLWHDQFEIVVVTSAIRSCRASVFLIAGIPAGFLYRPSDRANARHG
jgi:hypothetical protein